MLVTVQNQYDRFEMPSLYIATDEAFDLPLMIEIRRLFGWRAVPGDILGRDDLSNGTERLVASASFDGDSRRGGIVPDSSIRRLTRPEIPEVLSDPRLAALADLACS